MSALRRVALALALLVGALLAVYAGWLAVAHAGIRALEPALPALGDVTRHSDELDLPVSVSFVDTARQPAPRASVLEASLDPTPDAPYTMSHPAFVLEWSDGRILLVDVGMTRKGALEFGTGLELLGGEAIEPLASTADQLGSAVDRVGGVVFSHMHIDHTGGIDALCAAHRGRVRWLRTPLQARELNLTTRGSLDQLENAECLDAETLAEGPLAAVPGFDGVRVIPVAGHTPGSQIIAAHVRTGDRTRLWVFGGDIANHIDGVRLDLPKPHLYSLLLIPESSDQLGKARRLLRSLEERGAGVIVSHDGGALDASGLAGWSQP